MARDETGPIGESVSMYQHGQPVRANEGMLGGYKDAEEPKMYAQAQQVTDRVPKSANQVDHLEATVSKLRAELAERDRELLNLYRMIHNMRY